nr:thioredoxin domain-containing protein 11 [Leptinotarsa decemlineata]
MNPVWSNSSSCPERKLKKDCELVIKKSINHFCSSLKMENCMEIVPTIMENEHICNSRTVNFPEVYSTSLLTGIHDPRSAENLQKLFQKEKCKQFRVAEKIQPASFEKANLNGTEINISGLACKTNKSLSLLAMDSLLHYYFAQKLGINLNNNTDKSAVVILNNKMESHYILQEPINGVSVREFILNFTKNYLNRSFESDITLNLTSTMHPIYKNPKQEKSKIVLNELNTHTFLPSVLKENEAVAVFYYSKQCSFCNGVAFIYLTVAKKLSYVKNLVFARIDGENNILPWEYTMETYPTILFFPTKWKSESRVFPSGIPITVPNLIGFILTNLDPGLKLQAIWSICRQTKFPEEKSSCYSTLLQETLLLINSILKDWRISNERHKQALLHKLRQLRQLHLLFAHSSQSHGKIQEYFNKLNSYTNSNGDYHGIQQKSRSRDEL